MLPFFKRSAADHLNAPTFLKSPRQKQGHSAEKAVAEWLQKNGYEIIATNFRSKYGEIDIIATQKNILCFVEVKTRVSAFLSIAELVPPAKRKKIIATARYFLAKHRFSEHSYRFDIAYIEGTAKNAQIRYIPNAFIPVE